MAHAGRFADRYPITLARMPLGADRFVPAYRSVGGRSSGGAV
ncbi:hypothetical protein RSSM_05288 [Rhodopirellula sallentina SM41]|uniref:Uncharacterized protein n=1 Tax=Rhodopirellula sallentina SM41 TaxID=1263870 RepID=M5TVW8_9BACT|nr:hypothetical protein RSSM_05288 [Rhodopirellula sallentina SM41]